MSEGNTGESLARIEGKIDVLHVLQQGNSDDIRELRSARHEMNGRIALIEAANHVRTGESVGFAKALRAIYALATVSGLGSLAVIVKALMPLSGAK